ncbi:MAG: zinc ABC transporter substrate-binding protein [Gemmobacter sp.]|nr:zinc ABC transporter substrate-binding protein [Gemmobacter sp.]
MRLPIILSLCVFSSPVIADVPKVVTDIPAVHALVAQVMGDLGQPVLLLDRSADAHDFQLRPSQAQALASADLLVWIGPEMTPWLERTLAGLSIKGEALGLLASEGTYRRAFSEKDAHDHAGHAHDDGDDHPDPAPAEDHAHESDHEGHAHGSDGVDPHAWLDPGNAQGWLTLIAAELSHLDAANADTYKANADTAAKAISTLDATLAARLAPARDKPFVVFHDAYGYFVGHYGLTVAGSISLGDAAAPGAARLRAVQDMLKAESIVCIFPEAQHDSRLVETVVEGTTVKIGGTLDPSGSSFDPGLGLYAAVLTGLADTLVDCLTK